MNNKKLYLLAFVSVFLLASPASAGIEWISGEVCPQDCRKFEIPFVQGTDSGAKTTTYELKGAWLDYVNKVEGLGSGMTVTKLEQHRPEARLTLSLTIASNAAAGKRTLKLTETGKDFWGNPTTKFHDTLDIYIVRAGTFQTADNLVLPNYFTQATVIVGGTKLGNAAVVAAGWPQGTTASISAPIPPPNDNLAIITLRFSKYMAEASGDILLYDRGMPSVCKNLASTYYYKAPGANPIYKRVTIKGPNAIKSITFPSGPSYDWGSTVTIRLNLLRAVREQGETIYWALAPAQRGDGHQLAQGAGSTTYNPAAQFNTRSVSAGATSIDLTLKVCCCPSSPMVTVNTWIGSTSTNSEPGYKQGSFTVSCPTGFNANPKCP